MKAKKISSALAALILSVALSPCTNAEPLNHNVASNKTHSGQQTTDALTEDLLVLDHYTYPDTMVFDLDGALAQDEDLEAEALELASVLEAFGWSIQSTNPEYLENVSVKSSAQAGIVQPFSNCNGKNGSQLVPPAILLDSCAASALQNAITGGATAVELAGTLTAITGVSLALATPIAIGLVAQASLIGICGSWGNGIRLFPNGMCWSQ